MKEALWLACKAKTCCHTAIVVPSGRDVWRIARRLDLPPWTFLRYFSTSTDRPDAFLLDRSDVRYRLVLAKRQTRRTKSPAPCIFLAKTRVGDHRCGLGQLRPAACLCFPADLVDGLVTVRNDAGCTCRIWDIGDLDLRAETEKVEQRQNEAVEFHQVVATWNAMIRELPEGSSANFIDFCNFILEAYDQMSAPEVHASV